MGKYYVVDPLGGNEGLLWLLQARRIFLDKAIHYMQDEQRGIYMGKSTEWGEDSTSTGYYANAVTAPARNPVAYHNQLQAGAQFRVSAAPMRAIKFGSREGLDDPA